LPGQIYLIDEVLSVGDEYFQHKSWRRMRTRLAEGASGVVATHDFTAVLKLCDQAIILDRGRITARGPAPVTVQRYLELEPPARDEARFIGLEAERTAFTARTGQDFRIELVVGTEIDVPLFVGASIETFQRGIGWEHLLQLDPTPIGGGKGRHRVELLVPDLPLNAGKYSLNLFLVAQLDSTAASYKVLDAYGWSHGNGLVLSVDGPQRDGLFSLPVRWSCAKAAAA
jgi:lipopolysaccharide transport system ATP-binding protein